MSNNSQSDATGSFSPSDEIVLETMALLVLKAEETGDLRPVMDWLAHNPERACELAVLIKDHRWLQSTIAGPCALIDQSGRCPELLEKIGEGGMGVVYRAVDNLNREVAVKRVRPGLLSDTERNQLRYEGEVAARLKHDNVVSIHSFGEDHNGPFLVMPLITGGSLEKWLSKRGPQRCLEGKHAAAIVRDIAMGVQHAHDQGLIHRDLKPANILLDDKNRPLVADFGLARPALATVTTFAGTPVYMAPEQVRGEKYLPKQVDVHALGAILFELLTGGPPFGKDHSTSVMHRIVEENAPPVRQIREDAPRDLETICARCLKKEPGDRYKSAQALADDLQNYIDDKPIDSHRGWVWHSVLRALYRRKDPGIVTSWSVMFWGAASTFLAMTVMQVAVLVDAPLWVSQAAIAYYLLAWLGIMWGFLVRPRDALNTFERDSTSIYFGAKFSCMAILPVILTLHGGNPVFALPTFMVLVGLASYCHGIMYWGRYYVHGVAFFFVAAALPLVSWKYWPGIYGLMLGVAQLLTGLQVLREYHRAKALQAKTTEAAT